MKVRELIFSNSTNLKGAKEFNHLRVKNLNEFLNDYQNNLDYYESPFAILEELESQVKYSNTPEATILCSYKADGDVIFDFVEVRIEG